LALILLTTAGRQAADRALASPPEEGVTLVSAKISPPRERLVTRTVYSTPQLLGHIEDPVVNESSGLAASRTNPGLLWTHNDSGDGPFIYCLDMETTSCGTWQVAGAEAVDWEDMSAGPGPDATKDYLYIGDIGDNAAARDHITVYRVSEPEVSPSDRASSRDAPSVTEASEAFQLEYPDGPHDAETLMVHPRTGDLYIVTKEFARSSGVYRAKAPLDTSSTITLDRVATVNLDGFLTARTGGDISPDGRRVVFSTYMDGFELTLPERTKRFKAIWKQEPTSIALGYRKQGEAIAYSADGSSLFTTSEGAGAPLYEIQVLDNRMLPR
jgi:hypothetical protein